MTCPLIAPRRHMSKRAGFTLIELSVVLALVAVVMGVALFQLRGPYQRARTLQNIAEVQALDRLVRRRASQARANGQLVLDLAKRQARAFGPRSTKQPLAQVQLAGKDTITSVWLAGSGETDESPVVIPVGPRGQTPSYALRLGTTENDSKWLLFAARTGQVVEVANKRELQRVLQPNLP